MLRLERRLPDDELLAEIDMCVNFGFSTGLNFFRVSNSPDTLDILFKYSAHVKRHFFTQIHP